MVTYWIIFLTGMSSLLLASGWAFLAYRFWLSCANPVRCEGWQFARSFITPGLQPDGERYHHPFRSMSVPSGSDMDAARMTSPGETAPSGAQQKNVESLAVEEMLTRRNTEFEVIAAIAAISNSAASLADSLSQALELAIRVLNTHYIGIFIITPDGKPVHTASISKMGDVKAFHQHCIDLVDRPILDLAIRQRDWVRIPDVNHPKIPLTEQQRAAYCKLDVERIGVKPVISQDKVLGAILLMRHRWVNIPITEITFMDTFSSHVAILIENSRLRSQRRDMLIMEERRSLAEALHDSVTQGLFCLDMATQSLKNTLLNSPEILSELPPRQLSEPVRAALDLIETQTHIAQKELRSLINELRPVTLSGEDNLEAALKRHIASLKQVRGIPVSFQVTGNTRSLPLAIQRILNHIAQGALSNIGRHAHASHVWVTLEIQEKEVRMEFYDDGVGFIPEQIEVSDESYGLTSMSDQARLAGGCFKVLSAPGEGTRISVNIPLPHPQEAENGEG